VYRTLKEQRRKHMNNQETTETTETSEQETYEQAELRRQAEARAAWIQGLRDIADLFESKTEIPLPYNQWYNVWISSNDDTKEKMATIAKALAPCKKEYEGTDFSISRQFGPHHLSFNTSRDNVCERVVTGKQMVEARPSVYYPEVPAHEEDVVEWVCSPLLAASEPTAEEIESGGF
jgi:hypothetical protein